MKPSLNMTLLPVLLENDFNWLSCDDFGFTSLSYSIIYVGLSDKENVMNRLIDHKTKEKMNNKKVLTKRQFVFDRLLDSSIEIKWYLKSSYIPLVGKLLPSDTIRILKQGNKVLISFSICKVKKVSFSRHSTSVLFDFGEQDESLLTPYTMYLIDHPGKRYAILNEKFSLDEKKEILRAMVMNKKTKLKQKGDLLQNSKIKRKDNKDGSIA